MGGNSEWVQLRRKKVKREWCFLPSRSRIQEEKGQAPLISCLGGGPAFVSDLARRKV